MKLSIRAFARLKSVRGELEKRVSTRAFAPRGREIRREIRCQESKTLECGKRAEFRLLTPYPPPGHGRPPRITGAMSRVARLMSTFWRSFTTRRSQPSILLTPINGASSSYPRVISTREVAGLRGVSLGSWFFGMEPDRSRNQEPSLTPHVESDPTRRHKTLWGSASHRPEGPSSVPARRDTFSPRRPSAFWERLGEKSSLHTS